MPPSVLLPTVDLAVAPGSSVTTELRVRNNSDVVDEFTFQPLGAAADWITVEPPTIRLFPETDTVVSVTIAPPRASTSAPGPTTWAVKTVPRQHPEDAAVAEGVVVVGAFTEMSAELRPTAASARFRARYDVAVDNRGNVPLTVRIAGTDADQALSFRSSPASFETPPGTATFSRIKVRPNDRRSHGAATSHPFQLLVSAQPPAEVNDHGELVGPAIEPVVLNATLVQQPVVPKWLLKALVVAGLLLLALFILWKTLLKPTFESAARAVVADEVGAVDEQVAALEQEVDDQGLQTEQAAQMAAGAAESADQAQDAANAATEVAAGGGGALADPSTATWFRLETSAAPGAQNAAGTIVSDHRFALTDIVVQNPNGDAGELRILVDGQLLLRTGLQNWRDLDFHQIAPFIAEPGAEVRIEVDCAADQLDGSSCDVGVTFAGFPIEEG